MSASDLTQCSVNDITSLPDLDFGWLRDNSYFMNLIPEGPPEVPPEVPPEALLREILTLLRKGGDLADQSLAPSNQDTSDFELTEVENGLNALLNSSGLAADSSATVPLGHNHGNHITPQQGLLPHTHDGAEYASPLGGTPDFNLRSNGYYNQEMTSTFAAPQVCQWPPNINGFQMQMSAPRPSNIEYPEMKLAPACAPVSRSTDVSAGISFPVDPMRIDVQRQLSMPMAYVQDTGGFVTMPDTAAADSFTIFPPLTPSTFNAGQSRDPLPSPGDKNYMSVHCPWEGCGKEVLGTKRSWTNHLQRYHRESFSSRSTFCQFDTCHQPLSGDNLVRHITVSHVKMENEVCSYCGTQLSRVDALHRHQKSYPLCQTNRSTLVPASRFSNRSHLLDTEARRTSRRRSRSSSQRKGRPRNST